MANTFLTPEIIARKGINILKNNLIASSLMDRDRQGEFTAAAVGDTVKIRRRASFTASEYNGSSVTAQDASESNVNLTLEKHYDITVAVTSKDWTLNLQDFSSQILEPVMVGHAEAMDSYLLRKAGRGFESWVGNVGDPPDARADLTAINKQLSDQKVPVRGRVGIVDTQAENDILNISDVVQANQRGDSGNALENADMGRLLGVNYFMDQNVYSHAAGTFQAGSPAVNGAVSAGATTMNVDGGAGSETFKEGDLFTVAGASGQYVVTADATASSGSITGLSFSPAAPTGGFADNAALTVLASHTKNIAMNPAAVSYAAVPLDLPMGARAEVIRDEGLGVRVVYDYDTNAKADTISFDFLVGAVVADPNLGTVVLG